MAIKEAVFIMFFITLIVAMDAKEPDEVRVLHKKSFLASVNDGGDGNGIGEQMEDKINEITQWVNKKRFKKLRKRDFRLLYELSTMSKECGAPPPPPPEPVLRKKSFLASVNDGGDGNSIGERVEDKINEIFTQLVKNMMKIGKRRKKVLQILNELSTMAKECGAPAPPPPEPECEAGWVKQGESCYYIDDTPTQTWNAARQTCQRHGADLPIIKSADENQFIADLVFTQNTITWGGAWIGIQRNQTDDKLYWIDGTPVAGGYTAWAAGNPNNFGGNQDCGHIIGKADPGWEHTEKMWNDVRCTLTGRPHNRYPVILCEKSLILGV